MIRVLVAEDSPVVQKVLVSLFQDEEGIEIVGVVDNGLDAVDICRKARPDLVTMDIFMPKMDGLEATRLIMDQCPTRIVIISSVVNSDDLRTSFEAMRSGAIEVIDKPHGVLLGNYDAVREKLMRVVRQIMYARPARRFSWVIGESPEKGAALVGSSQLESGKKSRPGIEKKKPGGLKAKPSTPGRMRGEIPDDFNLEIVCIGGSTGAPAVLADVLSSLPGDFPVPIIVAQHIIHGFIRGMAEWLNAAVALEVRVAAQGDKLSAGTVLMAPDDKHLEVASSGRMVVLKKKGENDFYVPSVDRMFSSVAEAYQNRALGIILTGMGGDGAKGLLEMREAGAVTVGQSEASSVIYGMPRVADEIGAVVGAMDPARMAETLLRFSKRAKSH